MKSTDSQKKSLRQELRAAGRELSSQQRAAASAAIVARLQALIEQHPEWSGIASFIALPDEPDLAPLHSAMPGRRWCLPRIDADSPMHFHEFSATAGDQLVPGKFGLLQPDPQRHPIVPPDQISAILVPAAGLSPEGLRLGKGGGYYDRYLPQLARTVPKIGVVFEAQIRDQIPSEAHDCKVDYVITESR